MNGCEQFRELLDAYVDGTITEAQLGELKAHTESCEACRSELDKCVVMQDVIARSFAPGTTVEQAKDSVLERLSAEPSPGLKPVRYEMGWLAGRRAGIAAGILLAVGLALGFALGRAGPSGAARAGKVAMEVADVQGTVLVKHEGAETWSPLKADSPVYLGDRFHSAAKSGFVLEMEDESTVELNQNSMLVLKRYNGQTRFFLEQGECTAALESPHGPFFIDTPHGRVEALGTEFTVTVE